MIPHPAPQIQPALQIQSICAFEDNYIWLITQGKHAAVVDPGDANPVLKTLAALNLELDAILITHHHCDHIDGVKLLQSSFPDVITYAPAKGRYTFSHTPVKTGDIASIPTIGAAFQVIETPGHTLDHISFYGHGVLFCGDTLFGAGCGRLFEGTPEQLHASLQRIATLPIETIIYCTHEYTAKNLRFSIGLEPNNHAVLGRIDWVNELRKKDLPSIPFTLAEELATNPFLRCHHPQIAQAVGNVNTADVVTTFGLVRARRDRF
jgi:hydroxyacylglutathione hydrolase